MPGTKLKMSNQYHFESKESIEASLVTEPGASEDDVAPLFPSFGLAEPSPMCAGFHESWPSSPSLEWAWKS